MGITKREGDESPVKAGSELNAGLGRITDFLKTKRSKEELKAALDVLREFKEHENTEEWAMIPFAAWAKLEQMEEFLAHLVEGAPLEDDTIRYMNRDV